MMASSSGQSDLVRALRVQAQVDMHLQPTRTVEQHHDATATIGTRSEIWQREKFLGGGTFGNVYLERCSEGRSHGQLRAVKAILKPSVPAVWKGRESFNAEKELQALALFSQPRYRDFFVTATAWFDDESNVMIAMDYHEKGDLSRWIKSGLPEPDCRRIISQVLRGIEFMHSFNIAHRDLKPQNLLVVTTAPRWWVKIADFGVSKRIKEHNTSLRTYTGSFGFMAPEVEGFLDEDSSDESTDERSRPSYTSAVDVWAIGAICLLLLTGELLFMERPKRKRYARGKLGLPQARFEEKRVTHTGREFTRSLLTVQPSERPSASDALKHEWITTRPDHVVLDDTITSTQFPSLPSARWTSIDPDSVHNASNAVPTTTKEGLPPAPEIPTDDDISQSIIYHACVDEDLEPDDDVDSVAAKLSTSELRQGIRIERSIIGPWTDSADPILVTMTDTLELREEEHDSGSVSTEPRIDDDFASVAERPGTSGRANPSWRRIHNFILPRWDRTDHKVQAMAFSPDGRYLATVVRCSKSRNVKVQLWDPTSADFTVMLNKSVEAENVHIQPPMWVAVSPDSKLVALPLLPMGFEPLEPLDDDEKNYRPVQYRVGIWETKRGFRRGTTRMPKRLVCREAIMDLGHPFEEDDRFFTLNSALDKYEIEEIVRNSISYRDGMKSSTKLEGGLPIEVLQFDDAGTVQDHRSASRRTVTLFAHQRMVLAAHFSADGCFVATIDSRTLVLWNTKSGEIFQKVGIGEPLPPYLPPFLGVSAYSPNQRNVVCWRGRPPESRTEKGWVMCVKDLDRKERPRYDVPLWTSSSIAPFSAPCSTTFSPSGRYVALLEGRESPRISIWDSRKLNGGVIEPMEVLELDGDRGNSIRPERPTAIAFSHGELLVAVPSKDSVKEQQFTIWRLQGRVFE